MSSEEARTSQSHGTSDAAIEVVDILQHVIAALERSHTSIEDAEALLTAGFASPAYVWAVRSTEMLMRAFVLAPMYLSQGLPWSEAMRRGKNDLRNANAKNWKDAVALAANFWGLEDTPLLDDGTDAWSWWAEWVVPRRGNLIHGNAVPDATTDEASEVIAFNRFIARWYILRFLLSEKHPLNAAMRQLLTALADLWRETTSRLTTESKNEPDS